MRNLFFILIFITLFADCFAQEGAVLDDRSECLPFGYITIINGMLPQYSSTILKCKEDCVTDSIVCDFRYSQLIHCSHTITELCELIPDTSLVFIEYRFYKPLNQTNHKTFIYRDTLFWSVFKSTEVVCINDLNKKKQTYYIYYKLQPPWFKNIIYKKKYHVSKVRFGRRIFRGLVPTSYSKQGKPIY